MGDRGDDAEGRKIFVGGLPFQADEQQIRDDFGKFGDIEDVYLPADKETGKLRGFGFVTFKDPRDARDASDSMHGRDYHGRDITVNIARPRDQSRGPSGGGYRGGGDRDDRYGGDRRGGRDYDRRDRDRRDDYRRDDYDRRDRDYDRRDSYRRDDYDRRDDRRRDDRRGDDRY